jgi:hypothetical protein
MSTCSELVDLLHNTFESILKLYQHVREAYMPPEVSQWEIPVETILAALRRHHFNTVVTVCDRYVAEINEFLYDHHIPRHVSRLYLYLRDTFSFFSTEVVGAVRFLCTHGCPYFSQIPIADAQAASDDSDEEPFQHEETVHTEHGDIRFRIRVVNGERVTEAHIHPREQIPMDQISNFFSMIDLNGEQPNDPPPVYPHPPTYEYSVATTIMPLHFIRRGLEIFETLWDLTLNAPFNPNTAKYDMQDFQKIQSSRDKIMEAVKGDEDHAAIRSIYRELENLYDLVQWYQQPRTEEYFRRHYENALDTTYAFHVSCHACLTQMFHCYKEPNKHYLCANKELCQRERMRDNFEPNKILTYGQLFHIIRQRENFGMQSTFEFYAKPLDDRKFEDFIMNIETSMVHAGYIDRNPELVFVGEGFDLTFHPQPMHILRPFVWTKIFEHFRPLIVSEHMEHFCKFLSIALSGSLRHARLYHLAPHHLRQQIWQGRIEWKFIEPYSRNSESLIVRCTLDSIFGAYRNGFTWQLKPSFDVILEEMKKIKGWLPRFDIETPDFLRELNH